MSLSDIREGDGMNEKHRTSQETSASRWPMTRTQAFEKAKARFGATRTDVNEAAPRDGTRKWGRCKLFRRETAGEVCIGGGWTWEDAIADADAFHSGARP